MYESISIYVIAGLIQCPCCLELRDDVTLERRNTAYVSEQPNWLIACGPCHEEDDNYYRELWADYYYQIRS